MDTELNPHWASARAVVQRKWARLTEGDLDRIDGVAESLADCLRQRYGFSSVRALQEAVQFCVVSEPAVGTALAGESGAEGSYGQARTGEDRGREVPGDRLGHPGDSSFETAAAARRA